MAGRARTFLLWPGHSARRTIAAFGAARLVKQANGRHELVGGTADDQAAAREWCSLFAHQIVFSGPPRQTPGSAFSA